MVRRLHMPRAGMEMRGPGADQIRELEGSLLFILLFLVPILSIICPYCSLPSSHLAEPASCG